MSYQFVHSHDSTRSHDEAIWAMAWNSENSMMSAGADGKIILWDPTNGAPVRSFPQHPLAIISLSTNSEATQALSNSIEGTTMLWDVETGQSLGRKDASDRPKGQDPAWSVSLHPQGGTYAMTNASGNVEVLSASPDSFGDSVSTLTTGRNKFGLFVSHSPDGQRIAMSSESGAIFTFDGASGTLISTFSTHAMGVRSLAWSPDGQLLLSASDDKRLVLHDVRVSSGGRPGGGAVASMGGHGSWVLTTSVSSDSKLAISGSADRTIKMWDLSMRTCVSTIQEQDEVWGVCWRPGPSSSTGSFASSTAEGCVRFWRGAGAS